MAEKFTSLQVKKYNVPRYVVINYNYNYYRPYFKSEVLLFCKNYDNLAFLLGDFSISRPPLEAGASSNANFESITGWKQRLSLQEVLACCDTIPLSAVIWAPEVVDGGSIVLR